MENKEEKVEMTSEPNVAKRFGVERERKILSPLVIKLCAGAALICIVVILLKKPETPIIREGAGVKTPEATEVGSNGTQFDTYSVLNESEQLKEQNKKRSSTVIVR